MDALSKCPASAAHATHIKHTPPTHIGVFTKRGQVLQLKYHFLPAESCHFLSRYGVYCLTWTRSWFDVDDEAIHIAVRMFFLTARGRMAAGGPRYVPVGGYR